VIARVTDGSVNLARPYWSLYSDASNRVIGGLRSGPHRFEMQTDGNLVGYNGDQPVAPYWSSGTQRSQGSFWLAMQTDGNLVVYAGTPSTPSTAIWASNTTWIGRNNHGGNSLAEGQWIRTDEWLQADGPAWRTDPSLRAVLLLQGDGNLVALHTRVPQIDLKAVVWSIWRDYSGKLRGQPSAPGYLTMQPDRKLVLYRGRPDNPGSAYWVLEAGLGYGGGDEHHPPPVESVARLDADAQIGVYGRFREYYGNDDRAFRLGTPQLYEVIGVDRIVKNSPSSLGTNGVARSGPGSAIPPPPPPPPIASPPP
jgi:hypothetical protein